MPLFDFSDASSSNINFTQIIVDVGLTPTYSKSIMVVDGSVNSSSKILAWQDAAGFIGHPADEAEMNVLICSATPLSGSFNLIITSVSGAIVGQFLIDYVVS